MKKFNQWPPPDWHSIIMSWEYIIDHDIKVQDMLKWIDSTEGDGYHLSGYLKTEGFDFRFKNGLDATIFVLKWM